MGIFVPPLLYKNAWIVTPVVAHPISEILKIKKSASERL